MSKVKQARENSEGRANTAQGSGFLWTLIEEAGMYHRWSSPSPHLVLHSLETSVSMWTWRWWGKWGRSFLGLFSPSFHMELSIPQVLNIFSMEMTGFTKAACFFLHSSPLRREGKRKEEVARRQRCVKTSRKTTLCGGWNSFVQVGGTETLFIS